MKRTLHEIEAGVVYKLDPPSTFGPSLCAGMKCPLCHGPGQWRRGVGFEHERICMKCSETWEPGQQYMIVETPEAAK